MGLTYPFDPASFVLLRYATRPYSFMRQGALALAPWLTRFEVPYTVKCTKAGKPVCLYFTPIDEWQQYMEIDEAMAKEIRMYKQEIIDKVMAIRFSKEISKYQSAPSKSESALLVEHANLLPV